MNFQTFQSIGILAISASLMLVACSKDEISQDTKQEEPVVVQVGTASRQSVEHISLNGQIEPQETSIISTRVMGFISSIKVKPGDRVQKGALLLTISNGDILAKRAQAQASISEAEAAFLDAQKDYERFRTLFQQQSASAKELENATLQYNSIKARLESARQIKNESEVMLMYTELTAPFSGVISQRSVDEGSMANPGMPLLTIEQFRQFQVSAFVSESEVGQLKIGMRGDITIKSTGRKVTGYISEISPSSQFTGGRFSIKLTLGDDAGLFAGMFASIRIPIKSSLAVESLFVPASAIVHKDQLTGLYIVSEDQVVHLRWLKVGKELGNEIEILSGLLADEKFVTQSDVRLYNGLSVLVK